MEFHHRQNLPSRILRTVLALAFLLGAVSLPGTPANARVPSAIPAVAEADSGNIFGVEMRAIRADQGLDALLAAGTRWIRRNGVSWASVQPLSANEPFDWGALAWLDQELNRLQGSGVKVILVVRDTPGWARLYPDYACGPVAPGALGEFATFLNALVGKYKDRVSYWELGNEPDVEPAPNLVGSPMGCWGDPNDPYYGGGYYAEMLKAVYPAIKQADANAQVLVGGLLLDCDPRTSPCSTTKAPRFLEGILRAGGKDFFDGVAFHAYDYYSGVLGKYGNPNWATSSETNGPSLAAKAGYLRHLLDQFNGWDKYFLNTESALLCTVSCGADFETTKAIYVAQAYASALLAGLRANIWYAAVSTWKNSGLFTPGLTPLPAMVAFDFARSMLEGAAGIHRLSWVTGASVIEYALSGRMVWLVWSLDGNSHMVRLLDTAVASYSLTGESLGLPGRDATAGVEPVYIELPLVYRMGAALVSIPAPIANGNFELGGDAGGVPLGWSRGGELGSRLVNVAPTIPQADPSIPSGRYSLLLGSDKYACQQMPVGSAWASTQIRVPLTPPGEKPLLAFRYIIYSQDSSSSEKYDRFEVRVNQEATPVFSDGNLVSSNLSCNTWRRVPGAENPRGTTSGWATHEIDLTAYRGKTITVRFENWNRFDSNYNTLTYIDDLQLIVR